MTNRHFNIFISVYENKNMTMAADSLFISQPSVSQAIKEMENYYGVKLFERYPKKLYATPEGDLLYKYAQQILGMYDELKKEIQYMSENITINVGANISVGTVLIRDYINRFHETYPSVKIGVKVTGSGKLTKMLTEHSIDLALMEDLVYDSNLVQMPFYNDRIVFVCSPENPLAKKKNIDYKDLIHENFLLREKGVGVREKFDYLMKLNGVNVEPLWESSNTGAVVNGVMDNYGIGVLPYLLVKSELEEGRLVEMKIKDSGALDRNLNIVYHKDKILNKWTQAFIDTIKQVSQEQK